MTHDSKKLDIFRPPSITTIVVSFIAGLVVKFNDIFIIFFGGIFLVLVLILFHHIYQEQILREKCSTLISKYVFKMESSLMPNPDNFRPIPFLIVFLYFLKSYYGLDVSFILSDPSNIFIALLISIFIYPILVIIITSGGVIGGMIAGYFYNEGIDSTDWIISIYIALFIFTYIFWDYIDLSKHVYFIAIILLFGFANGVSQFILVSNSNKSMGVIKY